jgi:MoxR-like ATPase
MNSQSLSSDNRNVNLDPGHPACEQVLAAIDQVMVGKRSVAERLLCALIAGGHVLVEDVPGVGKTMLAKTLAHALALNFSRVQFTPDLLPSDLLGVSVWDPGVSAFSFRPGPVFTHLLLADEINRTSPRTQSALLEVMEENQVTVDGRTYPMEAPFVVVATENPIEYEGTFPLPEAQLDRFLFRLQMGYPSQAEEQELLLRLAHHHPLGAMEAVMHRDTLLALREQARSVDVARSVIQYLAEILARTRRHPQIYLGASPRAGLALLHAVQAWALMHGRDFVIPDDVRELALDVLAHRLIPRGGPRRDSHDTVRRIVEEILAAIPVPSGPSA